MIEKKLPILNDKDGTKMLDRIRELSSSYIPQWKFSTKNPDPCSVVAIIFGGMLSDNEKKYRSVVNKHKIQFLNLFDGIKEEPISSARSFVKFDVVNGYDEQVHIPKQTQLIAGADSNGQPIIFETCNDISAVPTEISAIYSTQKKTDRIVELFNKNKENDISKYEFTAFNLLGENKSEHTLILSYDHIFDDMDDIYLKVNIKTLSKKKHLSTINKLVSNKIKWALVENGECIFFDKVEVKNESIILVKENHSPDKMSKDGAYGIAILNQGGLTDIEITSISLEFTEENIVPDVVFCGGISQNISHFRPFGKPLELYAECSFECKKAFSRKGARVSIRFDLNTEIIEQNADIIEQDLDYKVIMKRPPITSKLKVLDVKPDYVIWEYLSENGWKRLLSDEDGAGIFNGDKSGISRVAFECPSDISALENSDGGGRIRVRLLKAENIYKVPSRQSIPVVDDVKISYSYNENKQKPQQAFIRNNFKKEDITDFIKNEKPVSIFYNNEHEKTAMYFGFEYAPTGTPFSFFLNLDNNSDMPIDFTVECLCGDEFVPLKVVDDTNSFLNSGTIMLIIPPKLSPKDLFGENLYWIRFINHNKSVKSYDLPTIRGIHTNIVQVVNANTNMEEFYLTEVDDTAIFQISRTNLFSAEVFVNEKLNENEDDKWVLWKKADFNGQKGRVYSIDLIKGVVKFEKYAFANIPVEFSKETVRVFYKCYSGAEANVGVNEINTLNTSIKFISGISNPIEAFGGNTGYTEETATKAISTLLKTRKRAVTEQDYVDIITQSPFGVKSIKCGLGINLSGKDDDNTLTIAVLMNEYEKGSHIFSAVKEDIRQKLYECSNIIPMGKELVLAPPYFVKLSVRLWIETEKMVNSFDLQNQAKKHINNFINPLSGGFDAIGWEIGVLPTKEQLVAYLKVKENNISITRLVMTAEFKGKEYMIDNDIYAHIKNPFAMAINGEHTVYISLK